MTIETKNLTVIKPSKNMRLTNGVDIAEHEVYLGIGDSADNWYEITEEEAQKIQAERNENSDV